MITGVDDERSFLVAGEFPRLASTAREAAEAVRSARPEGGASAFASAMPGTNLSSKMQGVEDKFADQATKTGTSLDEHAESLLAAEHDFIAAEEENGQLIGSIIEGHSYGAGAAAGASEIIGGHSIGGGRSGHSIGGKGDIGTFGDPDYVVSPRIGSQPRDWRIPDPIREAPLCPLTSPPQSAGVIKTRSRVSRRPSTISSRALGILTRRGLPARSWRTPTGWMRSSASDESWLAL